MWGKIQAAAAGSSAAVSSGIWFEGLRATNTRGCEGICINLEWNHIPTTGRYTPLTWFQLQKILRNRISRDPDATQHLFLLYLQGWISSCIILCCLYRHRSAWMPMINSFTYLSQNSFDLFFTFSPCISKAVYVDSFSASDDHMLKYIVTTCIMEVIIDVRCDGAYWPLCKCECCVSPYNLFSCHVELSSLSYCTWVSCFFFFKLNNTKHR